MSEVADRREQILLAAVGCFGRYGYQRTSMEMIARAAEMSRPALYQHFTGKEAVFRAMVAQLFDSAAARAETAAKAEAALVDRLHGVLVAKFELVMGHTEAEFRDELIAEAAALAADLVASFKQRMIAVLEVLLISASDELDLVGIEISAHDAAALLYDAVTGIEMGEATTETLYTRLRQLVELTARGLTTRSGHEGHNQRHTHRGGGGAG
jgi:TetR/AcrR family transcriptional regulator